MKYELTAKVTISIYTEVEADSLEEAILISEDRSIEYDNWSDKSQHKEVWVYEDIDGDPYDIIEE